MAVVDEVCADLVAEGDDLDSVVARLGPAQWDLPTPAPGWTIAHQVAHPHRDRQDGRDVGL